MSFDPHSLTLAEFIAWEERQLVKHEFRAGVVFAMAGASDYHNQIVANVLALVRPYLRAGPCRIYANDMMLVTGFPGSRYPDVMVTCDGRDSENRRSKSYPKLVIEVLSESTAAVDMGDKLDEYLTIETLEEYVLIDSRKPLVRTYRRAGRTFETYPATISGIVEFRSLGISVTVADLYEDVEFPARA
jgi:Uma2 family endonuclease